MRKTFLPLLFAAFVFHAIAADTIPAELAGEWAPDRSQFDGGALSNGIAIYINTNGVAAIVEAPPLMGAKWRAIYNVTNRVLRLSIDPHPSEGLTQSLTFDFIYDSKTRTLIPQNGHAKEILKHRRDYVPKGLIEDLE